MSKEQFLGIIRHTLTFIGGIAMAKGIIDEGSASEIVGGLMSLAGVVWSFLDKDKI
jgi:hypothetical protein